MYPTYDVSKKLTHYMNQCYVPTIEATRKLAVAAGLDPAQLRNIISESIGVVPSTAKRLAAVLEIPYEELYNHSIIFIGVSLSHHMNQRHIPTIEATRKFAIAAGIEPVQLRNILAGTIKVRIELVEKFAEILDIPSWKLTT